MKEVRSCEAARKPCPSRGRIPSDVPRNGPEAVIQTKPEHILIERTIKQIAENEFKSECICTIFENIGRSEIIVRICIGKIDIYRDLGVFERPPVDYDDIRKRIQLLKLELI